MGREIVYCENCGDRLTEDDFNQGKAQVHDNRPFCARCRPVTSRPPSTKHERATERRGQTTTKLRRPPSGLLPRVPPPPSAPERRDSRTGWIVGGIVIAVAIVVGALALSGGKERSPAEPHASRKTDTAREDLEERLRELETLAAATSDPQAILVRCDLLRATFRGTPLDARFRQIEFRAVEQMKEKEHAAELDRSLAAIRKIIQEDSEGVRRVEVEAMFVSALKKAGPREAEVRKQRDDYRAQCDEAAKRREAKKTPPPPPPAPAPAPARSWAECFTLGTARIQANDYPGAKTLYLEGLTTLPETRPEELPQRLLYAVGLYNLACIYSVDASKLADAARKEALDAAFKYLDGSLRSDFGRFACPCHRQTGGFGHMAEDKDLESVRSDARFAELLKKYRQ